MALERAEIVLPARGRFDLRATVVGRGHQPPPPYRWHEGRRPFLKRAEELADGSVHLLRIRPEPRGVVLEVTGRDAREIEVLAPLAARVRAGAVTRRRPRRLPPHLQGGPPPPPARSRPAGSRAARHVRFRGRRRGARRERRDLPGSDELARSSRQARPACRGTTGRARLPIAGHPGAG